MFRALSVFAETVRRVWRRPPVGEPSSRSVTLFISNDGTSLAVSVVLQSGESITVWQDGSTLAPDGVSRAAIESALSEARDSLDGAHVKPWF